MGLHNELQSISKKELIEIIQQNTVPLSQQAKQIQFLEEQILAYRLRQFANKPEKINPGQMSFFDEAELPKPEEAALSQEEEITVAP